MNIQEAKEEIVRTIRAYTKTDEHGEYRIPVEKQRPVLLMGPPGIGKTAIMEQIAREEGLGLAAYTMTHHTRQSAIGLPVVNQKVFHGIECAVTEYTMSEIIASIYEIMEQTGKQTGILFLDEINCVSETLAPVMLQLLQNKQFGMHKMPEGWLIAAAGNPPEYNKSVREFDMATLDRVKNIDVEADLEVWQKYAGKNAVHPAIRTYLTVHPKHFYLIEKRKGGKLFVTARGWEDLSCILKIYEEEGDPVTESFILQYLQHDEVARAFYLFYDLFAHFQKNTDSIEALLEEQVKNLDSAQAMAATSILADRVSTAAERLHHESLLRDALLEELNQWKELSIEQIEASIQHKKEVLLVKKEHALLNIWDAPEEEEKIMCLEDCLQECKKTNADVEKINQMIDSIKKKQCKEEMQLSEDIERAYQILENISESNCLQYLTADITRDENCCLFLVSHPSASYKKYCRLINEGHFHGYLNDKCSGMAQS